MKVERLLKKASEYKYQKSKQKFMKKHFGLCEGEMVTIEGVINLILKVNNINK